MTSLEELSKTVKPSKTFMLSNESLGQPKVLPGNIPEEVNDMTSIDDIYPSELLSAQDIAELGGKKTVVIKSAEVQKVGQEADNLKVVVSFTDLQKKLATNKTNAHMIATISGTKDYTQWQGIAIELYTILTTFRGKEVNAIRVRKPETPAEPTQPTGAPAPAGSGILPRKKEQ